MSQSCKRGTIAPCIANKGVILQQTLAIGLNRKLQFAEGLTTVTRGC